MRVLVLVEFVVTFPHGESITRLRPATSVDPYSGETITDWSMTPTSAVTTGWGVDDSRSAEPDEVAREAVITDFVLYRDEAADILPGDRVVVRGLTCEVVGRPATWRHPFTGWSAGFVVRANVVEG